MAQEPSSVVQTYAQTGSAGGPAAGGAALQINRIEFSHVCYPLIYLPLVTTRQPTDYNSLLSFSSYLNQMNILVVRMPLLAKFSAIYKLFFSYVWLE